MRKLPIVLAALLLACLTLTVSAAPQMLPFIYEGTMTLEVSGENEWSVPYMGEGEGHDDQYRSTLHETLKIAVPSLYVMNGVVADQNRPCVTTGSTKYERYKNGELIEYWDCPIQDVPPLVALASYGVVLAPPNVGFYYVGCVSVRLKGEHGEFDGTAWKKAQGEYDTHEVQIPSIPLPAESERLTGRQTIELEDGLTALLTWDFKPSAEQ